MNVGLSPISTFRARAGHFRSTAKSGHYIAAQYLTRWAISGSEWGR